MSVADQSRDKILARIRAASRASAIAPSQVAETYSALPRGYIRKGNLNRESRIALMVERLREYDAVVLHCAPQELPATIGACLLASGKHTFVVPQGFPSEWMIAGYQWKIDYQLPATEIDRAEGVLTEAFLGIADSGTIVLHHSRSEGRRLLSLLPEWHLCILRSSQVVETFPEYFDRCGQLPAVATFISGPSATADIEMTRIKGVHGPVSLVVIIVRDE